MNDKDFVHRVLGKPWKNRSCTMDEMDCWGLVVLYYRHVLGKELHNIAGYESGANFVTCYEEELNNWRRIPVPVAGCLAVLYYGDNPSHVGVMVNPTKCLHSRGEFGFVRIDNILILQKIYNKVEFLIHV